MSASRSRRCPRSPTSGYAQEGPCHREKRGPQGVCGQFSDPHLMGLSLSHGVKQQGGPQLQEKGTAQQESHEELRTATAVGPWNARLESCSQPCSAERPQELAGDRHTRGLAAQWLGREGAPATFEGCLRGARGRGSGP